MTDRCNACRFYEDYGNYGGGRCFGQPPSVHVFKNANDDLICEQHRPTVMRTDRACSLFSKRRWADAH